MPASPGFRFLHVDVVNSLYGASGSTSAAEYRFPLEDEVCDVVYAGSVFTHMLEEDCANYTREIRRILKPGGTAAISTFLYAPAAAGQRHEFSHRVGNAYVEYPKNPTKRVAYDLQAFTRWFGSPARPLFGRWRRDANEGISEWQDWVVLSRPL